MPELPEVEVTRRKVARMLVGRRIAEVVTTRDSYVFLTRPAVLAERLRGRRVEALERAGKYLLARLDDGARLLVHLGMTGELGGDGLPGEAHTHVELRFADGGPPVFFRDVRKFGKVQLLAAGERSARLDRLGPDALHARGAELCARLVGRRAPIKAVLLDQSVLAGVGNIYADEALFEARLSPLRPASSLTPAECQRLAAAVRAVLRRSIARGAGYREEPDDFRVYGRGGEPCRSCRRPLRRVVVAQRSTHYCPRCQRAGARGASARRRE
jgi:formamidopyrimidine-DNA glycosylase